MSFRKCKCKFCGELILLESDRIKDTCGTKTYMNFHKSKLCLVKYLERQKNRREFNEVYEYCKIIMGYSKGQQLSSNARNKIENLHSGEFIRKGMKISNNGYSYSCILTTLKAIKPIIERAFTEKMFEDEDHKFNYMYVILVNNINDVYNRIKTSERHKKHEKEMEERIRITIDNTEYIKKDCDSNISVILGDMF